MSGVVEKATREGVTFRGLNLTSCVACKNCCDGDEWGASPN